MRADIKAFAINAPPAGGKDIFYRIANGNKHFIFVKSILLTTVSNRTTGSSKTLGVIIMTRIKILLIFIICNCALNAQTYKAIYGDTSIYILVPCVDVPKAKPRWECYYERDDLKNGFYSIYYKSDTTKLYETFYIKKKKMIGLNKVYNKKGNLELVRRWRNGRVKFDSSFYDTGGLASIQKAIIGNFAKQIYGYTKSYFKNGKIQSVYNVGLFRIIERRFCENGKIEFYAKYRKRDNKILNSTEPGCDK